MIETRLSSKEFLLRRNEQIFQKFNELVEEYGGIKSLNEIYEELADTTWTVDGEPERLSLDRVRKIVLEMRKDSNGSEK